MSILLTSLQDRLYNKAKVFIVSCKEYKVNNIFQSSEFKDEVYKNFIDDKYCKNINISSFKYISSVNVKYLRSLDPQ